MCLCGSSVAMLELCAHPAAFANLCSSYLDHASRTALFCCCKALSAAASDPLTLWHALSHQHAQKSLLHFLQCQPVRHWSDDQLFQAVSVLLKQGAIVTTRPATADSDEPSCQPRHEVACLIQRACTRTLALLIKSRPACAELIKDYETLRAGVRSNKEFTFLFLTARGAKFEPHLEQLTAEAIRSGASKSLLWLFQWPDEMTPQKLQTQLQAGLPDPRLASCHDVAATMEVLLLHGLSPNCTVKCTKKGTAPTTHDAGEEHSLLEWAVLFSAAANRAQEAKQVRAAAALALMPSPPASPSPKDLRSSFERRRSGSVPDLIALAERTSGGGAGPVTSTPSRGSPIKRQVSQDPPQDSSCGKALVQVVMAHGATVNARKGGALLLAAEALQGDLVTELLAQGADVTLPRLATGVDLLRWAVDSKSCPSESGVLQALLQAVRGPQGAAPVQDTSPTPSPSPSPAPFAEVATSARAKAAILNGGRKTDPTPAGTPKMTNGGSKSGKLVMLTPGPVGSESARGTASPSPALLTSAVVPMVTLGGQGALAKAADEAIKEQADAVEAGTRNSGSKGSLLPSTLLSELQRDAALLEAVNKNDIQVVKCLLEAGADVHTRMDKAVLLALGAIDNNNPDNWMPRPRDRGPFLSISKPMVDLLLQHGADINARRGRAVCQAGRWRDTHSIQYLVEKGADTSWLAKDPVTAELKLDL